MDVAPSRTIDVLLRNASPTDLARTESFGYLISRLAKIENITPLGPEDEAPEAATGLVGELQVLIPLAGLIDKEAEQARLDRELAKLRKELVKAQNKLANSNFVDRAPPEVVEQERQRASEFETAITQLEAQAEQLKRI